MHVDLITLYLLAIGTLLASCVMTLWERRSHPQRNKELVTLAAAWATLAIGCASASFRHLLPEVMGAALTNLIMMCGYLLILEGVAAFNGRRYRIASLALLVLIAFAWAVGGVRGEFAMWAYISALPIALVSALTARELFRSGALKALHAQRVAALVAGIHAAFYAARAFVLPWLAKWYGPDVVVLASQITMYEGVLYSVVLPMTLVRLVREETHNQLVRESQTDYLTGLGNRRRFFEEGERVLGELDASRTVSLLAFDLDQFKAINDRYGHETGDAVLKSFAATARGVLGGQAILARIGGEEFAALLPGLDGRAAQQAGEAVVARFAAGRSRGAGGVQIAATVSGGLAHSANVAPTLAQLLGAADEALYRAKSFGGNRLELMSRDANARAPRARVAARSKTPV